MDNITPVPTTKSRVLMLDHLDTTFYKKSSLKIHSCDGEYLESIGKDIQKENDLDNDTQLRHQVSLVQSLVSHIDQHLELPPRAVYGLSDLLHQVEEYCERKSK
jgi:hypothetical protein